MCPLFLSAQHTDIIEIKSIMGTTESGENFTNGVSVFIVTSATLLVRYLLQKHTSELLGYWTHTVSPPVSFGNHRFQRESIVPTTRHKLLATCISCLLVQWGAIQMGLSNICSMARCSIMEAGIVWNCWSSAGFVFFRTLTHAHKINQQSTDLQAAGIPYDVGRTDRTQCVAHVCSEARRPLTASCSGVSDSTPLHRQSAHRIQL